MHTVLCASRAMSLSRLSVLRPVARLLLPRSELPAELHTSSVAAFAEKPRDRRDLLRGMPTRGEGVDGQDAIEIDVSKETRKSVRSLHSLDQTLTLTRGTQVLPTS